MKVLDNSASKILSILFILSRKSIEEPLAPLTGSVFPANACDQRVGYRDCARFAHAIPKGHAFAGLSRCNEATTLRPLRGLG